MASIHGERVESTSKSRLLASSPHSGWRRSFNKSKFVYKIKKDWRGYVTKRKSKLVVQGFLQQAGVDFNETYAPVAKAATF